VLVADDDPKIVELLPAYLERSGLPPRYGYRWQRGCGMQISRQLKQAEPVVGYHAPRS
jgi:hypothetical protein